jgi:hypothetical protein
VLDRRVTAPQARTDVRTGSAHPGDMRSCVERAAGADHAGLKAKRRARVTELRGLLGGRPEIARQALAKLLGGRSSCRTTAARAGRCSACSPTAGRSSKAPSMTPVARSGSGTPARNLAMPGREHPRRTCAREVRGACAGPQRDSEVGADGSFHADAKTPRRANSWQSPAPPPLR